MATQGTVLQQRAVHDEARDLQWTLATRVAFRFCFVYFGLYCVLTQIITSLIPISDVEIPDPSTLWPVRQTVTWTAGHVFQVTTPLVYFSGSGDKTFDWVLAFCLLVFAVLVTGIWSVIDRRRSHYVGLHKWFRLWIRFCLAGQMFIYGLSKAVPLQMPYPYLTKLLEPYGNMSPMGVLWSFMGASPAYEIFAGCAETLAGLLLIFPRTTTLGALLCLADMVQVFALNMAYDTPVKLFSFHLILMSLFLLAPDFSRLANLFFLNRPAGLSTQPPLFAKLRTNRMALGAQILFGLFLLGMNVHASWTLWYVYGGGQPKSALYGIWNVDQLTIDGQTRSPLLTDHDRWRRVILEIPTRMVFQRMDDSLARYGVSINAKDNTLALTKDDDKSWKASFVFQRPTPERLILDGDMDGHKLHMQLELFDRRKFLLVSRGFHWVQEYPLNR